MPLKLAVFLIRQSFLFMPPILPYSWRSSPLHRHTPTKLKRLFTSDNFTVFFFCTTGPSQSSHSKIMCASHRKIVYNIYLSCSLCPFKATLCRSSTLKCSFQDHFYNSLTGTRENGPPDVDFFLLFMRVMGKQHLPIPGRLGALCQRQGGAFSPLQSQ